MSVTSFGEAVSITVLPCALVINKRASGWSDWKHNAWIDFFPHHLYFSTINGLIYFWTTARKIPLLEPYKQVFNFQQILFRSLSRLEFSKVFKGVSSKIPLKLKWKSGTKLSLAFINPRLIFFFKYIQNMLFVMTGLHYFNLCFQYSFLNISFPFNFSV